jgi:hypothetical protein
MPTPKTADLLDRVTPEERARILKLADAAWDASYKAVPSAEVYTARQVADEARKAVVLFEVGFRR